ncbi:MAG TPA: S8 family serine peptidase [Symbiobacteriaceae bacterium]|nr:S8 family serine peptidase [Symbiobacteriaceae bacterium]
MQKGRMLALATAASIAMGAFGVQAWTASRDTASPNLPVLLRNGRIYMTNETLAAVAETEPDATGRNLYVVQFSGPVEEAFKSAVVRLGAELGDYLPENAFLVRMDGAVKAKVAALGFVKGVVPFSPVYKLDQGLARLGDEAQATVRISTFGTGTKGPVGALSALGVKPDSIGYGVVTATVNGQSLRALTRSTDVIYVEPVKENQLFNDKAAGVMTVSDVWKTGLDGTNQVVAITDTGLDTGKNDSSMHADFQGQIKQLIALGKPGDASDTLAHGTHVAGSVLGTGKASNGLYKGMAPGAKLVMQSVEDAKGGLGGIPEDLSQIFKQTYDAGARIHSNSWGVPATQGGTVYDAQSAAVDRFIWEHPDYTILFAAGNDGDHDQDGQTNYSTVSTPGTSKNAITVGASQNNRPDKKQGDNINGMASFSSRGPTADGRVKPDIVAPGTWIVSTRSSLADDSHFWAAHESNSKYGYMGGTSMATPLTAGATTLVRQFYTEKLSVTPKASLLKATLINGAAAMDNNLTWKDNGWGRVDINNSIYGRPFKFVNEEKALKTGEAQSYTYAVKAGKPLKITLAWSDYPANPSAEKTLVNDLDLVVKGPDGKEILGNNMIAVGADRTNNVENVVIAAPAAGNYTVTVKGYNVPQGPQRFALVASGQIDGTSQPAPPPTDPNPNPPPADKTAPTVSISSPAEGATVSGDVAIKAEAADNVGVSKVLFYVDGNEAGTAATAPFSLTWSSTAVADGVHTLVANAYDAAGNVSKSTAVKINVKNAGVVGTQELQFTGKANAYGTVGRHYVDVKAGGAVKANLAVANGTANLTVAAYDAAGRQVATGDLQQGLSFTAAAGGTYSLAVINNGGYADYALQVTYPLAAGAVVESKTGTVTVNTTRYQTHSITLSKGGSVSAILNFSDPRADLDVYLVDRMGRIVAQGTSPNLNPETLSASVPAGTYTVYVVADSGKADYQLSIVHPK